MSTEEGVKRKDTVSTLVMVGFIFELTYCSYPSGKCKSVSATMDYPRVVYHTPGSWLYMYNIQETWGELMMLKKGVGTVV